MRHHPGTMPPVFILFLLLAPLLVPATPAHAAPRHAASQPIRSIAQGAPLTRTVARIAHPPEPLRTPDAPIRSDASGTWRQTGLASWYGGKRWQGKPTFSGAPFNQHALTAAHATLPMGAKVRVTVADTGRSVVVTINDRPGTRRRIIDLSRAAAARLGIIKRGIAPVILVRN